MATAFDNKKYDIQLNSVPYRIRGYQRSELSTFIPRLGSGEQSESEFDLLRSASLKGFTGGELQRFWDDDTSAFGLQGMYNKYEDGVLYPAPTLETVDGTIYPVTSSKPAVTAKLVTRDYLFVAYRTYAGVNGIYRTNKSGTTTAITVPAGLSGSAYPITSMVMWKDTVMVCDASTGMYKIPIATTTATLIAGGIYYTLMVVFNGSLYGTGGAYTNRILWRYTGDLTTGSHEMAGDTSKLDSDYTANLFIYNNRIILTRLDGIYGYDGIQLRVIEDMTGSEDVLNYKNPCVLKGYLYYFMPDGMYRFNGSLIEKLYDVSESGIPESFTYGNNKIWYVYRNSAYAGSTRYDKSMGYDYETGDNVQGRLSYFDGKGMYTYSRLELFDKSTVSPDFSGQGEPDKVLYFNGVVYVSTNMSKFVTNLHRIDTTQPTIIPIQIVTSIFDAGFTQVDKQLENLELDFDGDLTNHTFTVQYRIDNFEGDTGWASLGTLTSLTNTKLNVYDSVDAGVVFRKIQFKITASMTKDYGIKNVIIRYVLTPDYKYQWTFTALCYGDSDLAPLALQDTVEGTQDVATLRGNIYQSRESDVPIGYVDLDYLVLNEALDNSETGVDIISDAILKSNTGFIQVGTEIMKYTKNTSTNLTVERGVLGSTATTHATGIAIYPYYRVIVRSIQNERIELSDEESTLINRTRDSEITLVLQEV